MKLAFTGAMVYWRGPAPWHFVEVPEAESDAIDEVARFVTYGWGVIPVEARIGDTTWTTSLFPKDGRYLVPVKAAVRSAVGVDTGDAVDVVLAIEGA